MAVSAGFDHAGSGEMIADDDVPTSISRGAPVGDVAEAGVEMIDADGGRMICDTTGALGFTTRVTPVQAGV